MTVFIVYYHFSNYTIPILLSYYSFHGVIVGLLVQNKHNQTSIPDNTFVEFLLWDSVNALTVKTCIYMLRETTRPELLRMHTVTQPWRCSVTVTPQTLCMHLQRPQGTVSTHQTCPLSISPVGRLDKGQLEITHSLPKDTKNQLAD